MDGFNESNRAKYGPDRAGRMAGLMDLEVTSMAAHYNALKHREQVNSLLWISAERALIATKSSPDEQAQFDALLADWTRWDDRAEDALCAAIWARRELGAMGAYHRTNMPKGIGR